MNGTVWTFLAHYTNNISTTVAEIMAGELEESLLVPQRREIQVID